MLTKVYPRHRYQKTSTEALFPNVPHYGTRLSDQQWHQTM